MIRGINLGGWFSQIDAIKEKDPMIFPGELEHIRSFLKREDFERVRAWGFDHVRLPVDYFNLFAADTLKPDETVLALLDAAVDSMLGLGLQVILDLHKCPGHDFHEGISSPQAFFSDGSVRANAKRVWATLAERYGSRKGVLLEILNEPVAPDSATWNHVKDEMAGHIRRYAPDATMVVGSNLWNSAGTFKDLVPIDDPNVLYSFHYYQPILFTHQMAPWVDAASMHVRRSYPASYDLPKEAIGRLPIELGRWDRDRMRHSIDEVCEFRAKYGVPVACNEFGVFVGGAKRIDQLAWLRDFVGLLLELEIAFTYWNYKNLDFGIVSHGESLFANYPQYANAAGVDMELADLLRGAGDDSRMTHRKSGHNHAPAPWEIAQVAAV